MAGVVLSPLLAEYQYSFLFGIFITFIRIKIIIGV